MFLCSTNRRKRHKLKALFSLLLDQRIRELGCVGWLSELYSGLGACTRAEDKQAEQAEQAEQHKQAGHMRADLERD